MDIIHMLVWTLIQVEQLHFIQLDKISCMIGFIVHLVLDYYLLGNVILHTVDVLVQWS